MQINYRFSINGQSVSPLYKDGLSKEYAMESQQRFYRASLSGSLTFLRTEFDWLNNQPFDTEFSLLIEMEINGSWSDYWSGKFYKTDCQWDPDNRKVVVKTAVKDDYSDVLTGMGKEYNLIKLAPALTPVSVTKRPLLQVYVPGDNTISCFLSGTYWEQDTLFSVDELESGSLISDYHFEKSSSLGEINISGDLSETEALGRYSGGGLTEWTNAEATYKIKAISIGEFFFRWALIRMADSEEIYASMDYPKPVRAGDFTINPTLGSGVSGSGDCQYTIREVFTRYMLDVDTLFGVNTYGIPSEDITANNRNYRRVIGHAHDQYTTTSAAQIEPTEFGRNDDGLYFKPPPGDKYYPIARSTWGLSSIWFNFSTHDANVEIAGRKAYILKDAIMLSAAIKVLLAEIAPGISHEGTAEYSEFLYGVTNPITLDPAFRVMLTQKSNVLAGEYDRPAQKAPITLTGVTNMLKNVMRCYWYIEDNKFKIEHLHWFKNGGSYSWSPQYSVDLTTLTDPKNKKLWGLGTSPYTYGKLDMEERIEFSWMDDVTDGFGGQPIEITSNFVQKGKIETINAGVFTSDVDYMLANPGSITSDGFALFGAEYVSGEYKLPFVHLSIDEANLVLQNGFMSWVYLQPKFWVYDLPSTEALINGGPVVVEGVQRKKKQTIKFPSILDLDPVKLIKTNIGDGEIQKISVNLSSRMNTINLKYDTE
jgi:hypothetical protein